MAVTIGIPKERRIGETRVAILPEQLKRLLAAGKSGPSAFRAIIESGAGTGAFESDENYVAAGASIATDSVAVASAADILVTVNPPQLDQVAGLRPGAALVGMLRPTQRHDLMRWCGEHRVTAIAFEALPRITRAQKADALSSMSTVAGYRAVIHAAAMCPKFFPMMMTAAGTITPARVLIVGAGVAGLQAIATARRLGAVVEGYDIRPAAKEQVLSLGARFVELDFSAESAETTAGYAAAQSEEQQRRQSALLADHVAAADVVITTALVPGRPAPKLISAATVERMRPGSVLIDLAAEAGGNCELTQADQTIDHGGVRLFGPTNLPAETPVHASRMYGQNALELIRECVRDESLVIDLANDMVGPATVVHEGEVLASHVRESMGMPPLEPSETSV